MVIGAALAPSWYPGRLGASLAAFFLAVGIGAHALDELNGRPLSTRIPSRVLAGAAAVSIAAAVAIGIAGAIVVDLWLLAFVAAGAFIVCAYNLELFGGRLHSDAWFALDWGAFPLLTAYFACAGRDPRRGGARGRLRSALQLRAAPAVQPGPPAAARGRRHLGDGRAADGSREPVTRETLILGNEAALRALALAMVALAVALAVLRAR